MFHLYLVTKPKVDFEEVVLKAIKGGVTSVQLRDKRSTDQELIRIAKRLQLVLPTGIPLIINDRLNVAKQVGAGLHVGIEDVTPDTARQVLGAHAIIGLTIHDRVELAEQYREYINYVGVGPVFPTQTKVNAEKHLGVVQLQDIVDRCPVPVVAIGGITPQNVQGVRLCGVLGVAVCSSIMDSAQPDQAALQLGR
jgi:thiamine-phosphate pyrophosphorylase